MSEGGGSLNGFETVMRGRYMWSGQGFCWLEGWVEWFVLVGFVLV